MARGALCSQFSSCSNGHVQFVAKHDDETVDEQPQHDEEQCADGAVEEVVAVEVGQIDLESPRQEDEHDGGEHGPGGEESHTLFFHGDDVIDNAECEQGHAYKNDPTPDADNDVCERARHKDALAEQPYQDGLVAYNQHQHQYQHDVQQKHQRDADDVLHHK